MTEDVMKLECRACGSSLEYSAKDQTSKCPYCGAVTEIPRTEKQLPDTPSAILPLTVELTELTDAVYEHLASGDMTPDQLLEHATFTKKERFYAPAYGFRGNFVAKWTASFGYNRREEYTAYETRTDNGQSYRVPVTKTRTVTDWRPASGTDTGDFAVLAYAGKQLCEATVDAISLVENQPGGDGVPFNPSYTTGVPIEPYAVSDDGAYRDRAQSQVNQIIDHSVHQHAQGDRQKDWHWTANINKDSSTILVPICHAIYEYQGTSYHAWVRGTNASRLLADKLPVDVNRQRAVKYGFLPLIVAAIASAFAVFGLSYNPSIGVFVVLAAVLYGLLRRSAIIKYSKQVRQFLLANRRAAATNTAAMTPPEQGVLIRETARPEKPWLAHTTYDHIVIPLVIMIVALIPFAEFVFTPGSHKYEATSTQQEDNSPTANVPPVSKSSPAGQNIAQAEKQPSADNNSANVTGMSQEAEESVKKAESSNPKPPDSSSAPEGITAPSARVPGLSGIWQGEYTNTNQITKVNLRISEGTDLLTGTLMFDSGGNNSASCAITGVYNAQNRFLLLSVGNCQGRPPAYLQGKIGFSSVKPTDRQVFGVDSLHNSLLNISRQ